MGPYCTFWFHDTNAAHARVVNGKTVIGPNAMTNIIRFRIKQKPCFNWNACTNSTQLLSFLSCIPSTKPACSYADKFLVRMLLNFDSAIIVGINYKGPFTPPKLNQQLSFWGWACASEGIKSIPTNGKPYESGKKRASNCDPEHPKDINGLCYKDIKSTNLRQTLRNVLG